MFEWKHPDYYTKIKKDFHKEARREEAKLKESYRESLKQTKERKDLTNNNKYDRDNHNEKI